MQVVMRPIGSLRPHPGNYRRHPAGQVATLATSLSAHGWARPIVIAEDGTILAGHGLFAAAKQIGEAEVPCVVYTGSHPEAFLVMDNRSAEMAETDTVALLALITGMDEQARATTGYDDEAMLRLAAEVSEALGGARRKGDGLDVDDELASDAGDALSERVHDGQVWTFGCHEMAVGDPADAERVASVMRAKTFRLAVLSPRVVDATEKCAEDLFNSLTHAYAYASPGASAYLFLPPDAGFISAAATFNDVGFRVRATLCWPYEAALATGEPFRLAHTNVLYAVTDGGVPYFSEDRAASLGQTLLAPMAPESILRPPAQTVMLLLETSSRVGDVVFGTAQDEALLIGCERMGRVARFVADARAARGIIGHWEAETGTSATVTETT